MSFVSGKIINPFFNKNPDTLGLKNEFYSYIIDSNKTETISFIRDRYNAKIKSKKGEKIKRIPDGKLKEFKTFMYKQIFPKSN